MGNEKFEEIFDNYTFTERIDNSIKSYSNWLLGISIGLAAILITLEVKSEKTLLFFIFPIVLVFIGVLYSGYVKRAIFLRELKMNLLFSELKKIKVTQEAKNQSNEITINEEGFKNNWFNTMNKYWVESEKLKSITTHIHWSSTITFINVIVTGLVLIFNILFKVFENCI